MKNRKSSSEHNKVDSSRRSEIEIIKSSTDIKTKKKSAGSSFFQKSQQILQTYNALFKKTTYHLGDADTYFRQSLRNYDDFDIFKTVKWEAPKSVKSVKSVKSFETTKDRRRVSTSVGDGDRSSQKEKLFEKDLRDIKGKEVKVEDSKEKLESNEAESEEQLDLEEENLEEAESDFDDDKDNFYSPSSQKIAELEEIKEVEESDSKTAFKMEGEEGEVPFSEENEPFSEIESTAPEPLSEMGEGEGMPETETEMADESGGEEGDFNINEVEQVLGQVNTELNEIIEDNPEIIEAIADMEASAKGDADKSPAGTKESAFKFDPNSNNMLMKELEDAEKQAKETGQIIYELKIRLAELCSKEKMTDAESAELEEKNKLLKKHMDLFEEKTKRIQFLVGQANLFENLLGGQPVPQQKHKEDALPKVIICGMTEDNMPKIIVCDDKKKKKSGSSVVPQFAKRLSESYNMQEKLAAENADLEGMRYQLQEDLLNKDQTVESLQRKLHSLQTEMRMVCKENCLLSDKLEKIQNCPKSPCPNEALENNLEAPCTKLLQKMKCGKGRGPCPADVESRLQEYSQTTQQLEKQLGEMENEVRVMQTELVSVQKERQHLEHHRRMLCTPPPCPPPPCMPPPKPPCPGPCNPSLRSGSSDQQLRELREQYNRLQDDYKGKLTEVAGLRADNEKFKQTTKEAEEQRKLAEDKMKEYEKELRGFKMANSKLMGSKEQLIEQEQQLNVAKQRFREAQDELEELRALIQDQQAQLDDYRNKYLQAQQQVEEQRRQIDMMEMENNRVSEQVNLEIQRVKNQFQEKLQELTPLPDILKATQLKLQEAQQMHLLAERNNEQLTRELQAYRDRAAEMANQMEKVRSDQQLGADEKATLQSRIDEWERKCNELQEENDTLRTELARMEEVAEQNEKRVQEKLHEIAQLVAQLETVREESARQVARTKDRCETVRRSMQNQIADLERQLAQSRAQARAAQKDRDEIRQKMQSQINNLNENFEDAQMRIRNLQGHVNFLKNSYTNVFPPDPNMAMISDGMDACDCGNSY